MPTVTRNRRSHLGRGVAAVFTALFPRIITSAFGVYRWLYSIRVGPHRYRSVDQRRPYALHCLRRSLARVSFAKFDRLRCRFDVNSA